MYHYSVIKEVHLYFNDVLSQISDFVDPFFKFIFHFFLCYVVLSVDCSLVVTCWERTDLLVLFYVVFSCVFVTFP